MVCSSRAGMGERKGEHPEIQAIVVLGNIQRRKMHEKLLGGGSRQHGPKAGCVCAVKKWLAQVAL